MADDTINACPECDSSSLRHRTRKDESYICKDCRATFDDPVVREKQAHGISAEVMLERVVDDPEAVLEATEL